jgi:hypothetical protein
MTVLKLSCSCQHSSSLRSTGNGVFSPQPLPV